MEKATVHLLFWTPMFEVINVSITHSWMLFAGHSMYKKDRRIIIEEKKENFYIIIGLY
jgi:hypothetical protein